MAITCINCGYAYNSDDAEFCSICNASLLSSGSDVFSISENTSLYEPVRDEFAGHQFHGAASDRTGSDRTASNRAVAGNPGIQRNIQNEHTATPENIPGNQRRNYQRPDMRILEGRISYIERNEERPPGNIFRFMAKFLIGLLFFIPYIGLFIISCLLSLFFAIFGFESLSRFFSPFVWSSFILEFMEIMVLHRIRGSDTIPVYRGMVENTDSEEFSFIFFGPIRSGNLVAGHNVRLNGYMERRSFITQNGIDMTSNAEITSYYRNPWRFIFCLILLLYIIIGFGIYLNSPELAGYFG